jgi:sulfatase maturation enzyme AslB (radical SAM superfamily)
MTNKSFCSLGFNHISTRPDGMIRVCCNTHEHVIRDDNGIPFNFGTHSVDQFLNSTEYKQLRQDMIDGKPIPACSYCYDQEKFGNESPRFVYNRMYPMYLKDKSLSVERKPHDITYLDLRFGNMCNLKCVSCGPHCSSQIDKETKMIAKTDPDILSFQQVMDSDINAWYKTDTFTENLDEIKNKLKLVYLTGGEPTIVEENYNFMQLLIDKNLSKNIKLKISTNLTNVNPRFFEMLKQFNAVQLMCSIDGVGHVQEYLRPPSKWNVIDANFRKVLELENAQVMVTPMIQNLNLEFIADLFEYVEGFNKTNLYKHIEIYPYYIYTPPRLKVQVLPVEYRKYCWDKIESWLNKGHSQHNLFKVKIDQLRVMCLDDTVSPGLDRLKRIMEIYDKHRNLDMSTFNPRLAEILKEI